MDDPAQALAYAEADFNESNSLFCDLFAQLCQGRFEGRILDLGCGPADIPIRLARRFSSSRIDAVDGALAMLELARNAVAAAGLHHRIGLIQCHLPADSIPGAPFDAVVSNSLLHHLTDPGDLWSTLAEFAGPDALVLVMDLKRPPNAAEAARLVERYAADAPAVLQRDFHNSLLAAYTVTEVRDQLAANGLCGLDVEVVSDRHLAVRGRISGTPSPG